MELGEKLKAIRKEKNISATSVAEKLGVSKSTISNYEKGIRTPGIETLEKLAEIYSVNIQDILYGDNFGGVGVLSKTIRKIPVLGTIRAGNPVYAEENIIGYTDLTSDYSPDEEYFALYVIGDSMNRCRICEGDTVIVRRQSMVDNGDIAIVLIDSEEATIKKFFKNENIVTLMPCSTNTEHQQRQIDIKYTPVEVLGKVVEVKIKL